MDYTLPLETADAPKQRHDQKTSAELVAELKALIADEFGITGGSMHAKINALAERLERAEASYTRCWLTSSL